MTNKTGQRLQGQLKAIAVAGLVIGAAGCGGTITFQGQSPIMVSSSAPPAPPPAQVASPPARQRVAVRANKIEIGEKIQFEQDKAVILEASFGLLNEVVDAIKKIPT